MAAPIYADSEDLIVYSGPLMVTPEEADRKLARASRLIDSVLIGAVYPTDPETKIATNEDQREAIKNATCAQAAYWISGAGSEHGAPAYDSVSIGSVRLSGAGKGNERGTILAPQAFYELSTAGLTPVSAVVRG
jgi:hypothetical protein